MTKKKADVVAMPTATQENTQKDPLEDASQDFKDVVQAIKDVELKIKEKEADTGFKYLFLLHDTKEGAAYGYGSMTNLNPFGQALAKQLLTADINRPILINILNILIGQADAFQRMMADSVCRSNWDRIVAADKKRAEEQARRVEEQVKK